MDKPNWADYPEAAEYEAVATHVPEEVVEDVENTDASNDGANNSKRGKKPSQG